MKVFTYRIIEWGITILAACLFFYVLNEFLRYAELNMLTRIDETFISVIDHHNENLNLIVGLWNVITSLVLGRLFAHFFTPGRRKIKYDDYERLQLVMILFGTSLSLLPAGLIINTLLDIKDSSMTLSIEIALLFYILVTVRIVHWLYQVTKTKLISKY